MKKVKISELTRVSSLTGAEIVPFAKDGSNGAVTTAKLKEYAQPDLSAITTALGGKVDKVTGKGLSTNDYTDADKEKLDALPIKAELDTSLASKQPAITTTDDLSLSAQSVLGLTDKAKMAELIAAATAAGAVYNRATGYFELNTLTDITAAQMRTIMAAGARQSSTLNWAYVMSRIRTHLPRVGEGQAANAVATFRTCYFLEAVEMPNLRLQGEVFFGCNQLRSVNWKRTPIYDLNNTASANFQGCSKLIELRGCLRSNFDFNIADSPLLSLASFQYMVANAANTTPITVTVHPEVYAKLTATEHSAQARSNLALKSDVPITSANYPMAEYALNEVPEPGEVLTVTVWGTPSEGCNMYMTCYCGNAGTEGVMTEISTGVWQRTIRVKDKSGPTGVLYIFSFPNKHQSGHIDKVKICYGLDPSPQWSAPVEMPTDPEAIEAIGWERVMLMAAAEQINFATT